MCIYTIYIYVYICTCTRVYVSCKVVLLLAYGFNVANAGYGATPTGPTFLASAYCHDGLMMQVTVVQTHSKIQYMVRQK